MNDKSIIEPNLYSIYISTKKLEIMDIKIRQVLEKFIRGGEQSTSMLIDMIGTGSDIIIGTHPKDIADSRVNSINQFCNSHNINLHAWVKVVIKEQQ